MENKEKSIEFHPLVPDKWDDLEQLFGKRALWEDAGACFGGRPRLNSVRCAANRTDWHSNHWLNQERSPEFWHIRATSRPGWCAIGPRESYSRLERTKVLAPIDTQPPGPSPVFISLNSTEVKGLMRGLLNAAIDWAGNNGARIIESYPFDPAAEIRSSAAYTGVVPVYIDTGFIEVMRRSPRRPIMRNSYNQIILSVLLDDLTPVTI